MEPENTLVKLAHAYNLATLFDYCPAIDENESAKALGLGDYTGLTPVEISDIIVSKILTHLGGYDEVFRD
jgi:hypothetical protein